MSLGHLFFKGPTKELRGNVQQVQLTPEISVWSHRHLGVCVIRSLANSSQETTSRPKPLCVRPSVTTPCTNAASHSPNFSHLQRLPWEQGPPTHPSPSPGHHTLLPAHQARPTGARERLQLKAGVPQCKQRTGPQRGKRFLFYPLRPYLIYAILIIVHIET